MVFTPMDPSVFVSPIEAAPHTIEQKTSGTTSICIRRRKPWPTT